MPPSYFVRPVDFEGIEVMTEDGKEFPFFWFPPWRKRLSLGRYRYEFPFTSYRSGKYAGFTSEAEMGKICSSLGDDGRAKFTRAYEAINRSRSVPKVLYDKYKNITAMVELDGTGADEALIIIGLHEGKGYALKKPFFDYLNESDMDGGSRNEIKINNGVKILNPYEAVKLVKQGYSGTSPKDKVRDFWNEKVLPNVIGLYDDRYRYEDGWKEKS